MLHLSILRQLLGTKDQKQTPSALDEACEYSIHSDIDKNCRGDQRKDHVAFDVIKKYLPSLIAAEQYDVAVEALEKYCDINPYDSQCYLLLAYIFQLQKNFSGSHHLFRCACFLKPQNMFYRKKLRAAEEYFLLTHQVDLALKMKCYATASYEALFSASTTESIAAALALYDRHRVTKIFTKLLKLRQDSVFMHLNIQDPQSFNVLNPPEHILEKRLWRPQNTFPFSVVASHDICSGTVIASESPFAIAPLIDMENPRVFPTCFHCLRERGYPQQAFACPAYPKTCPFVFCSQECVLKNVNVHRQECRFITSIVFPLAKESNFTPGFILLLLRVMIRAFIERSLRQQQAEEIRFFFRLYTDALQETREWFEDSVKVLARRLTVLLPLEFRLGLTTYELEKFILAVHTYAVPITYEPPSASFQLASPAAALGLAMASQVCSFQHSCFPNSVYTYNSEGRIVTRSLYNIPAETPITISYVEDLLLPTAERKHPDTSLKVILCRCKRCSDITEDGRFSRGQYCVKCVRGIRNPCTGALLKKITKSHYNYSETCHKDVPFAQEASAKNSSPKLTTDSPRFSSSTRRSSFADSSARWVCTHCGSLTPLEAQECDAAECDALDLLRSIRKCYALNKRVKALKLCERFLSIYEFLFHNNHYILYNVYLCVTGLLKARNQTEKALIYLTRALYAAHSVLPEFHSEKIHLYIVYSSLTLKRKGSLTSLDAMWIAVVNAWFTRGPESHQWIASLTRLRHMARLCNVHTPPLLYKMSLCKSFNDTARKSLELLNLPHRQSLKRLVRDDHQFIIFSACVGNQASLLKRMLSNCDALRRELECPNLMTGLSALGSAAAASRINVVDFLLSLNLDIFVENEWNITPLLAMASRSCLNSSTDQEQACICEKMCRYVDTLHSKFYKALDAQGLLDASKLLRNAKFHEKTKEKNSKQVPWLRFYLLLARSHSLLGANTSAHYATSLGKEKLLFQLFHEGVPLDIRNGEEATVLHIASLHGHVGLTSRLLQSGCSHNARNSQGQTPLMLACYNLHVDIVRLFVKFNANFEEVTEIAKMTCIHSLVLGLTKTHFPTYLGSDILHHDKLITMLSGMNRKTANVGYDACGDPVPGFPPIIGLTLPFYQKYSAELFLFPDTLQARIRKATAILEIINRSLPNPDSILSVRMRPGLTPSELLKARVDLFLEMHQDAWKKSNIDLTTKRRKEILDTWNSIFIKLDRLICELDIGATPKPDVLSGNGNKK